MGEFVGFAGSPGDGMSASLERSAFGVKGMEVVYDFFPKYEDAGGVMQLTYVFSSILATLSLREEALRQTILAVGLVTLGKSSEDQALIRKGQSLYGEALQEMGVALRDPERRKSEALLATTRLLGLYEILHGTDQKNLTQARNWMSHAQGELALIVGRGPEAYTTDSAHLLFTVARYSTVGRPSSYSLLFVLTGAKAIAGVRSRKPSVLNEERWKTIPWRGRIKPARDTILDILLEIPEILSDLDYIDSLPLDDDCFDDLRLKATAKCWTSHGHLDAWFKENAHKVHTTDIEAPVPIDFANLGVAMLSLSYWATATLLYQSLDRVLRFSTDDNLAPYINRPHGRHFARLIVRSVAWLFRKDNGVTGATGISFPLGVAMMYLRQSDVPDPEYTELVFSVWNDPEWPSSIKVFLKSMANPIKWPAKEIPKNPATWSTSELSPIFDKDGNVLTHQHLKDPRLSEVT
jgi:hypothetical protein